MALEEDVMVDALRKVDWVNGRQESLLVVR
jgi:hypothetical protein